MTMTFHVCRETPLMAPKLTSRAGSENLKEDLELHGESGEKEIKATTQDIMSLDSRNSTQFAKANREKIKYV